MNKGFWTQEGGVSGDSKFSYENSPKMESKRSHQWFMDNTEADLFPHKKQNIEVQGNPLFSGIPNSRVAKWEHTSGFQTVNSQTTERLFDIDSSQTFNFDDRHIISAGTESMNVVRKDNIDPFGNDSSFGLSMSHTLEEPKSGINYSGYRKVKVSQVKDSDNILPMSMGQTHTLHNGDAYSMSNAEAYSKADVNFIHMSHTYDKSEGHIVPTGGMFHQENNSFISMGLPFSKQDSISINQVYRPNDSNMSTSHSFCSGVSSDVSVFQTYSKGQENEKSKNPTSKNNIILMGHSYSKENESQVQLSQDKFSKRHENDPGDNSYKNENMLMGDVYSKRDTNSISFGGYDDEPNTTGRLICNYNLLMGHPPSEKHAASIHNEPYKHHVDLPAGAHQAGGCTTKEDSKTNKKDLPNSFPSNVRSLLSTGILDGVPVKYVVWSREKETHAVIKGTGYLCSCQLCKGAKVINAYEFERHAGCKTKHPNNHIYFENGKTIYAVVQELRNTPQNILFEVIQTITGSPINQKSFRLWKESFLAATRELQRIYGKDEAKRLP